MLCSPKEVPKERCSAMPRIFACPSSLLPTEAPCNMPSDESDLGTAVHAALGEWVLEQTEVDLELYAKRYGVALQEMEPLYHYGTQAWAVIHKYFAQPKVEEKLNSDLVTGHTDLLHADGETLVIGDWKTGRLRRNYRQQLASYAYAAHHKYGMPASGQITAIVIWLRFCELEVLTFTEADLEAFRSAYLERVSQRGQHYAPGEHCQHCPRQLECKARQNYVHSAQASLMACETQAISPEALAALYPHAKMLEKALETYRQALKLVLTSSGPLPINEELQIGLIERRVEEINARAAWPILEEHGFDENDLAQVISMSKSTIQDIVSTKAPRGEKNHRKAALFQALRQAGAISTSSHVRLDTTQRGENR